MGHSIRIISKKRLALESPEVYPGKADCKALEQGLRLSSGKRKKHTAAGSPILRRLLGASVQLFFNSGCTCNPVTRPPKSPNEVIVGDNCN